MTHESMPLASRVAIYKRVRDEIAASAGLDEDDAAVLDTAEGETDLAEYLVALLRAGRLAAAHAKGIGDLQKDMTQRRARLTAKADRIEAIVLNAMADAGLPKLTAPDFTVSRRPGTPGVRIADESLVPEHFCRIKREPDKAAIRKALLDGASFDFAHLGNAAEILFVRTV